MNKGSPYLGVDAKAKRPGILRSPSKLITEPKKTKEVPPVTLSKTTVSKLHQGPHKTNRFISRATFKGKTEPVPSPNHIKSRSLANFDLMKLQKARSLQSLSPVFLSPKETEGNPSSRYLRTEKLLKDLMAKLQKASPVDIVTRSIEAIKTLRLLGESDIDLTNLMAVVTKEFDEGVVNRQVLERKLEHISRENFSLSKQLEANETQTKPDPDPFYDQLTMENLRLTRKVEELECKLRTRPVIREESSSQQSTIRSGSPEIASDTLRAYQFSHVKEVLIASRLKDCFS